MREGETAIPWWRGCAPLFVLPGLTLAFFPAEWPRWAFMWTLAVTIYAGCKWLTWRRTPLPPGIPAARQAAYLLGWPGMDARTFLTSEDAVPPTVREWLQGVVNSLIGVALFWYVPRLVDHSFSAGWLGMLGIAFMLHFGFFRLMSCLWRTLGRDARRLMDQPLRSVSVGEFWSRRWNMAFRDLMSRFLFRPLTRRLGSATGALWVGFLVSGLIHDLVITVPAGGGWGLPTLFFLIQAVAILLERSTVGQRLGLGQGLAGWLFTLLTLVGPAVMLFPPPFVIDIMAPFMQALGAWR